ncbi:MAG TPA: DUF839 domain-containing protein [Rhodocyclaceae bacterium]|nr:DUF839 domain-containing protein [Rhodocyclaceae bacterium]
MFKPTRLALAVAAVFATPAFAANSYFSNYTPLAASSPANPVNSPLEATPLTLSSPNFSQKTIADRATQLGLGQSNSGNWDMITANETGPSAGRYLFMPFETGQAGVQRIDLQTMTTRTIVDSGTQAFVSGDASRWTSWGSYLTAEESWGSRSTKGCLFEITNPLVETGQANMVLRNVLPRVSHEGLAFDKNNALYFIDELNGGSIYRYVSANPNATSGDSYFDKGQTFVLKTAGGNNANAVGAAVWEPITDAMGGPLANTASAFVNIGGQFAMDGRVAANLVGGTDYQRPEDIEIKTLANGDQILFVATTTTHEVYSINLASNQVKLFVSRNTLDAATGLPVGSAFTNPDNLAIDADGNIYIVEDQPGGRADIWFAKDADHDGVAESVGRWASMNTAGAEPTGLYFDTFNPNIAYVNIQHPDSGVDRTIQISAVPEPESYALLLAGLGMIGLAARRRGGR